MNPTEHPEFSPYSIARMIWKQKWLILVIFAVLTAASVVVVQKLPSVYEASAVILVDSQKIPSTMVPSTVVVGLQDRLANLAQQILSSNRLQSLIEQDGLYREERKTRSMEDVIEQMRSDIDIHLIHGIVAGSRTAASASGGRGNPDAFSISFQSVNSTTAALVANQLANLFIEENLRARERYASDTSSFIDQQLDDAKKSLDQQEAKVSQFKLQHSGELPEQENALIAVEGRLQTELQSAQDAIDRAQQNKVLYQNSLSMTEASLASLQRAAKQAAEDAAAGTSSSTAAPPPVKASDMLRSQLAALRLKYTDDFPEIKRVKRELAETLALEKKQEEQMAAAPTPPAANAPAPAGRDLNGPGLNGFGLSSGAMTPLTPEIIKERDQVTSLKNQLAALDLEIQRRTAEQARIRQQMAAYQSHIDRLPISQQDLAKLTRDYEISRQNYQTLLNKKFSADMSTDMEMRQQAERFTLIESATVPELPVSPKRLLLDGAAALVAFGLAMAIGFLLEFRKNLFLGEWEFPNSVPVLGRVPAITLPLPPDGTSEYSLGGGKPPSQPLRIA